MPDITPILSVRVLGPLDLGGIRLPTRKAEVLLSYLALGAGRPHRRDSLMGLLWEDRADKQARHSLSQTLFSIRKALGEAGDDCLEIDGDTVALVPRHAYVDARDFERLAAARAREPLAEAAALYRGDLLQGINLRAIAVQDWLSAERTRYRELALATLARLAALREQEGDLDGAVQDAVRIVALDPLQESAHRLLMRLYAAQDRPAAALRQYERLTAILRRELDEEPEAATRQLHAEIGQRRRRSAAPAPEAEPVATPVPAPRRAALPPCTAPIGRDAEFAQLDFWFGEALGGRRRTVFVTGGAGLGKTTLLDAFVAKTRQADAAMVGRGQCIEHRGAGEPFMPVLEALAELCRTAPALRAAIETHAPSWTSQLPGLAGQAPNGIGTRERLLRELLDALESAAAMRPLVLVIEDLHWSDASTLDMIDALARRRAAVPLMLLATCRSADGPADGGAFDLIRGLTFRSLGSLLPLPPLDEAAVERCLAERFPGGAPPAGLAAALVRRGGGNPLFMLNLLEWWLDRGLLVSADGALRLPDAAALDKGVPESLGFLVGQQLDGLAEDARAVLEAASVCGDAVPAAAVAAALPAAEEAVEAALAGLARRGLFMRAAGQIAWPDGTATARFDFLHQLYRECIYERLTPALRRRLHGAVGGRLEQAHAGAAAPPAAELALHFAEARDAGRAVHYLEEAAQQALGRSAHGVAVELLDRALPLLPALEPGERAVTEIRLQAMRAPALVATRGWLDPAPEAAFRRACDLSRQVGDRTMLASAMFGLAALHEFRGDYRTTQDLLIEQRQLLDDAPDNPAAVLACELMACSTFHNARFAESVVEADRAISGYVAARDMHAVAFLGENPLVSCHCWAGRALWFMGRADEALARLEAALRAADADGHSFAKALAHEQMARLHEHRGEPAQALAHAEAAMALGEEYGFPYRIASGLVLRGWARTEAGDAGGLGDVEQGLAACRRLGAFLEYPYYQALLARAQQSAGRPAVALATLEEALAQSKLRQGFFYESEILRLIAGLRAATDPAAAEEALRAALATARAHAGIASETPAAVDLARLLVGQGREAEAWQVLDSLVPPLHARPPGPAVVAALDLLERTTRKAPLPAQQVRFCTAPDGAGIAYSAIGQGLPLVKAGNWLTHLEHDWHSPIWRPLFEELARAHCLVRYDPRGTGLSDWNPPEIAFERWIDDLDAVVEAARLDRFALLGISQGAAVSIAYAARRPGRVSHLVLLGGYARGRLRRNDPAAAAYEQALNTLIRTGWGQDHVAFRQMFSALFLPEGTPEQIQWFAELERVSATPENAVRVRETNGACDVTALLPGLDVPTLVLHARRDAVVPFEEGRLMAAAIPNARFVPLDSCNHLLLPHEPAWGHMLAEMTRFLTEEATPQALPAVPPIPPPRPSWPGSAPGAWP